MHFISFLCIVFSSLRINHVMYVISLNNTVLTHCPTQLCLKFTPPLFSAISSQSIGILFFSKLKTKQKIWDRSKGDGVKNKCSELGLFFILKKMLLKFTALDRGSWCYLLFQNKGCVDCRADTWWHRLWICIVIYLILILVHTKIPNSFSLALISSKENYELKHNKNLHTHGKSQIWSWFLGANKLSTLVSE